MVIASGKHQDSIDRIIRGENIGTLFINQDNIINELNTVAIGNNQQIQLTPSEIAINARNESRKLIQLTTKQRSQILLNIANALNKNRQNILESNKLDLQNARKNYIKKTLLSRLKLTNKKLIQK